MNGWLLFEANLREDTLSFLFFFVCGFVVIAVVVVVVVCLFVLVMTFLEMYRSTVVNMIIVDE